MKVILNRIFLDTIIDCIIDWFIYICLPEKLEWRIGNLWDFIYMAIIISYSASLLFTNSDVIVDNVRLSVSGQPGNAIWLRKRIVYFAWPWNQFCSAMVNRLFRDGKNQNITRNRDKSDDTKLRHLQLLNCTLCVSLPMNIEMRI